MITREKIGVLSIQGDFAKHIDALLKCGVPNQKIIQVKVPKDLEQVNRLILPGGESTTVGLLMERYGLATAIQHAAKEGMPLWGTCMGMILLAKHVENYSQKTLGVLDISVKRNAFGTQIHSFEESIYFAPLEQTILGVFIRAPIVTQIGDQVKILAEYNHQVIAVQQNKVIATSFHPELTDDIQMHQWFLRL